MTRAKISLFCIADGRDANDGSPLVKITKGKPIYMESVVRLQGKKPDIRPRPMWEAGWEAQVRIRYDRDEFTAEEVANLMMRVGLQVGVGEGRPDSPKGNGMGWGLFEILKKGSKS